MLLSFQVLALGLFGISAEACMHYDATLPYDTSLPFEAKITDNGVVTCWISMSYDEHKRLDHAPSIIEKKNRVHKRSNGETVSLTDRSALRNNQASHDARFNLNHDETWRKPDHMVSQAQEIILKYDDPENPRFAKWNFECIKEGQYKAYANVGARTVKYFAHGQDFFFIPDEVEDVVKERWDYKMSLWCAPKKGEKGYKEPTPSPPTSQPKKASQPQSESKSIAMSALQPGSKKQPPTPPLGSV